MESVFQYIEKHQQQYIGWLKEACNQPSVSSTGEGMAKMKDIVIYFLKQIDASIHVIETDGYPIIYAEIQKGKNKTLTFYNHYDVQPPEPIEAWQSEPFVTVERDDKLFARGIADNKGNLIARICAVHAYMQTSNRELPINLKFIIEGEEEVGSPHLPQFAELYPEKLKTDAMIWEGGTRNVHDKRPHISFGVKGICYVEMTACGASSDLHSSEGAIIENPAWRLVWALSTIKDKDEKILIKGFYNDIVPLTKKEENFLKTMDYDEEYIKQTYKINQFLNGNTGTELRRKLIFEPTCTICGIESGFIEDGMKTVLPSKAKVKLDFRLVNGQSPEKIMQLLREHLDTQGFKDIELKQLAGLLPFNTEPNNPFIDTVIQSVNEVYKEEPIILRNLAGSSPMEKLLKNTKIPAVQIGVANTESNYHAPNENIFIDDFIEGIKVTANIIANFNKY